jgi:hypothetical protein
MFNPVCSLVWGESDARMRASAQSAIVCASRSAVCLLPHMRPFTRMQRDKAGTLSHVARSLPGHSLGNSMLGSAQTRTVLNRNLQGKSVARLCFLAPQVYTPTSLPSRTCYGGEP